LLLPVLNHFIPFSFYFEGSLKEHKNWFPTFYFLSFAFFKSFYPLAYAVWLYALFRSSLSRPFILSLICIQTTALIACMEVFGFETVSLYAYLLAGAGMAFRMRSFLSPAFSGFIALVASSRILKGSFLFITYIVLCLTLNRFHPFAKYTMFNRFAETTRVFLLRDASNKLLPLNTYCTIDGNHLFELYVAFNKKHGFKYGSSDINKEEQTIVSREMVESILKNLKRPIPSDSIKLSVERFYFDQGKLTSDETQLYTCKVE
jgi:hypothetical protein